MIVVDSYVIAYLFIEREKTALAQQVLRLDSRWAVPFLWRHEFLDVLATYARYNAATFDEVVDLWLQAFAFASQGEYETDMVSALEIAVAQKVSAYDAQYVSLARNLQVQFVSEDRRLVAAFPSIASSMQSFCAQ